MMTSPFTVTPLHYDDQAAINQIASFLPETFRDMAPDYIPDVEAGLNVIDEMFQSENINLAARDDSGVIGWIGGAPIYDGFVYELHPLAVRPDRQRMGVGMALVAALEAEVAARGAGTLYVGTDDLLNKTTLGGIDLYPNPLEHLARIQDIDRPPVPLLRTLWICARGHPARRQWLRQTGLVSGQTPRAEAGR